MCDDCAPPFGRLKEDKPTYAFFLDVQKVYDTVWRDSLRLNCEIWVLRKDVTCNKKHV